jgi:hypothetical protein
MFTSNIIESTVNSPFLDNNPRPCCFPIFCDCRSDSIFSSFTGSEALMLLVDSARAFIHSSMFRDLELDQEIFDVSFGSAVRLENCTFTNVTVPDNDYVSTSLNDGELFSMGSLLVTYYPEDDAGPSFDVQRHRANNSSIPEEGM